MLSTLSRSEEVERLSGSCRTTHLVAFTWCRRSSYYTGAPPSHVRYSTPTPDFCKVAPNPCGFCGGGSCNTTLTMTGNKREVESNCPLRCSFRYGAAQKSTRNSPCTNTPIKCPHCSETVWKYNAANHVMFRHNDLLDNGDLDPRFIVEIQFGKHEGKMMGIPNNLTASYFTQRPGLFPSEEDLAVITARVQNTGKPAKRRCPQVEPSTNKKRRS
jgi:hypothetical protein